MTKEKFHELEFDLFMYQTEVFNHKNPAPLEQSRVNAFCEHLIGHLIDNGNLKKYETPQLFKDQIDEGIRLKLITKADQLYIKYSVA